mmetsp:Transcript_41153/g.88426  ORF Transcript_41153/g.88426 Transcript_41153/m.88426 type:complete len:218 (+) Transcript_41153:397-1050(+)
MCTGICSEDLLLHLPLPHEAIQLLSVDDEGEVGFLVLVVGHGSLEEAAGRDELHSSGSVLALLRQAGRGVDPCEGDGGAEEPAFGLVTTAAHRCVCAENLQDLLPSRAGVPQLQLKWQRMPLLCQSRYLLCELQHHGHGSLFGDTSELPCDSGDTRGARLAVLAEVLILHGDAPREDQRYLYVRRYDGVLQKSAEVRGHAPQIHHVNRAPCEISTDA